MGRKACTTVKAKARSQAVSQGLIGGACLRNKLEQPELHNDANISMLTGVSMLSRERLEGRLYQHHASPTLMSAHRPDGGDTGRSSVGRVLGRRDNNSDAGQSHKNSGWPSVDKQTWIVLAKRKHKSAGPESGSRICLRSNFIQSGRPFVNSGKAI